MVDTYLGIPYSNDMWPVDFKGEQISDTSNWRKNHTSTALN